MAIVKIPNGWAPRDYQMPAWKYFEAGGLRACLIWHRRAGKDDLALHLAAVSAVQRVGNYWHMLPEASQARRAIWNAVNPFTGKRRIDEAFPDAICRKRDQDMLITFVNGSTWQVVGSDNYDSLVGAPPIGIVFSEWALAKPKAWAYLSPILRENGGWAVFITTPRSQNHAYDTLQMARASEDWFAQVLPATETGVFSPEQLIEAKQELIGIYGHDVGMAAFNSEYMCDFNAGVFGAVYAHEMRKADTEGRICLVPYSTEKSISTFWDLGERDNTSIWFVQRIGMQTRVIDFYENHGHKIPHYLKVLQSKEYVYDTIYLPHDAEHAHVGAELTIAKQIRNSGYKVKVLPRLNVVDGVNAARTVLDNCWFDEARCKVGIEALRKYQYDVADNGQWSKVPLHNEYSHAADAFRYMALGLRDQTAQKIKDYQPKPRLITTPGRPGGWMS